jgi:hypothetical protein
MRACVLCACALAAPFPPLVDACAQIITLRKLDEKDVEHLEDEVGSSPCHSHAVVPVVAPTAVTSPPYHALPWRSAMPQAQDQFLTTQACAHLYHASRPQIRILQALDHPHITKLLAVYRTPADVRIVQELCKYVYARTSYVLCLYAALHRHHHTIIPLLTQVLTHLHLQCPHTSPPSPPFPHPQGRRAVRPHRSTHVVLRG